jgi:copper chaperone CopZ
MMNNWVKQRYEFTVAMTCEGCSKALDKILSRQKGELHFYSIFLIYLNKKYKIYNLFVHKTEKGEVTDYNVDLSSKNVSVTTAKELAEVVAILEKSGKRVEHLRTHAN